MKIVKVLVIVLAVLMPLSMKAQSSATEMDELKAQMRAQQKLLEKQQAQIQTLESALATQQKMLASVVQRGGNGPRLAPAVDGTVDVKTGADEVESPQNRATPSDEQPLSPQAKEVEAELERGPEIADVTPLTPALQLGPAKVRVIGYPALTAMYRSNQSGGNVGTSFTSIPFSDTVPGNASEFRLSPQSTRLALRVDADLHNSKAAGYFETDFAGTVPDNVAVSSSSYGFRIRQAWFDYSKGKFEITGGQLFSLMTPAKKDILPWPGDVALTQVIDTNYVAGLVWGRYPQVRLVYHYSKAASFGLSIENPEQQVGNGAAIGVTFPAALASTLNTQYNVGTNGLAVPNATPDFVLKGSFDGKLGGHAAHLDVGGLLRVFRNYAPFSGNGVSGHNYAVGGGGNANFTFEIAKGLRLVLDGFASSGGGRYIGGLAPDVIVRANGQISPITSYSWVSGFEIAPNEATGLYAYFSGLYARRNTAIDADGSYIGWGYPGSSNAADRLVDEVTGGYSRVLWSGENLGSVQFGVQYSYVSLQPWVSGTGPAQANANMVLTQVRYNLP
jgi:hypothetical protein